VRNDRQLFLRAAGDDKLQDFAFARSQSMGALITAMSNRAVPIAVQILGGGPGQSWFGPDEWRLRVRNHGAVVGAPMAPRVVSASASLEMRRMLIACGCRDYSVRTPITESIPTAVCGAESKRVSGKFPADSRNRSQNHHRRT
jgi:hypothetical protein